MAITSPRSAAEREPIEPAQPIDDYHVQADPGQLTQPVAHHVLGLMYVLMLIVLAVLSFALFWVAATLLGIL